ncbi:DUF3426 domain-containing protein [Bacterioplanoides sp.]|uniref:DUF3426 domain-containing protein n=1 Tax=Bacterioplanoides sp. TaxID=2066072 RepID=UPI003B00657F
MATHVTRCPHCRTTFRVRDEHLKVADGAVRCGSCLQVFKAASHFVTEQELSSASSKPETESTAAPKPESVAKAQPDDDDDFLIHDDMDDDALISDDGLIHDDMTPADSDTDDDSDTFNDDPMVDFGIVKPENLDRPAPRNDLEIDASIFDLKDASATGLELVDSDANSLEFGSGKDPDEAWADALLDDDDDISVGGIELSDNGDFNLQATTDDDEFSQFKAGAEQDDFQGFAEDDDNLHLGEDDLHSQVTEINVPADLNNLQDDPLQLSESKGGRSFPWGWSLLSVIMVLVAAAQTFYFNFDQWSRTPQWRPWYAQACTQLACQLPQIQNVQQMSTQHLVVRSHPQLQSALVVDTLIQNQATYQQPFPDLQLVFSDLNNGVVASRRFKPGEYLSGELAGQQQMPVNTPIHIALEIADPGPEAVSYAVQLIANQ